MNLLKLLIANVFVAAIMALALTGTPRADGIDDPKFYTEQAPKKARHYGQLFDWCMISRFNNMSAQCRIYDDMGPLNWPPEIIDIPSIATQTKQSVDVPEPTTIIILIWSAALFYGYRKVLK
jgi:hypothetical protein